VLVTTPDAPRTRLEPTRTAPPARTETVKAAPFVAPVTRAAEPTRRALPAATDTPTRIERPVTAPPRTVPTVNPGLLARAERPTFDPPVVRSAPTVTPRTETRRVETPRIETPRAEAPVRIERPAPIFAPRSETIRTETSVRAERPSSDTPSLRVTSTPPAPTRDRTDAAPSPIRGPSRSDSDDNSGTRRRR
jgi:hypothetical protein